MQDQTRIYTKAELLELKAKGYGVRIDTVFFWDTDKVGDSFTLSRYDRICSVYHFATIKQTETQADLWHEVFDLEKKWHRDDFVREAQQQYTITRKTANPNY